MNPATEWAIGIVVGCVALRIFATLTRKILEVILGIQG